MSNPWQIQITPPMITYIHPRVTITVEAHPVNCDTLDYSKFAQELLGILNK